MAKISKNPNWSIMVRFSPFLWLISSVVLHTKILAGQSSETVEYNPSARKYILSLHSRCKNGNKKLNTMNNSNSSWTTWGRCWPSCWYDPYGPMGSYQWLCMCLGPCYELLIFFFFQFLGELVHTSWFLWTFFGPKKVCISTHRGPTSSFKMCIYSIGP